MGQLAAALAALAAVPVTGVTSYALDETPGALMRAQLPALVIEPELGGESPGLEPNLFATGAGTLAVRVTHLLLVAPVAEGLGARGTLPDLIGAVDVTIEAMADDPTLGGALPVALRLSVQIGVVRYASVDYHGAIFTHAWMLYLT